MVVITKGIAVHERVSIHVSNEFSLDGCLPLINVLEHWCLGIDDLASFFPRSWPRQVYESWSRASRSEQLGTNFVFREKSAVERGKCFQ